MRTVLSPMQRPAASLCTNCGIPVDSQHFDDSSAVKVPDLGHDVILARFELPAQYCGVLETFFQFTDAWGKDQSNVDTPGLEWVLLVNQRPLYPYNKLTRIVNPWGYCAYPVTIRLDDSAVLEFLVRAVGPPGAVQQVGGRIAGRYWYNAGYGDVERRAM